MSKDRLRRSCRICGGPATRHGFCGIHRPKGGHTEHADRYSSYGSSGDPEPVATVQFCESRHPKGLRCVLPIEHTDQHLALTGRSTLRWGGKS